MEKKTIKARIEKNLKKDTLYNMFFDLMGVTQSNDKRLQDREKKVLTEFMLLDVPEYNRFSTKSRKIVFNKIKEERDGKLSHTYVNTVIHILKQKNFLTVSEDDTIVLVPSLVQLIKTESAEITFKINKIE